MGVKISISAVGRKPKYKTEEIRKVIDDALIEEAQKINGHFDTIFSGFERTRPSMFTSKIKKIGYDREIWVYTARKTKSNGILSIMNFGLGPRSIVPKPGKGPMVFPIGYWAATKPHRIYSRRRAKFGPIRKTMLVQNHTIRERRFDKAIVKRRLGYFKRIVQGRTDKIARSLFN